MKLTVIGIGVAALIGGTALAASPISIIREPVRVQRVSFADLNLATSDGRAALDGQSALRPITFANATVRAASKRW